MEKHVPEHAELILRCLREKLLTPEGTIWDPLLECLEKLTWPAGVYFESSPSTLRIELAATRHLSVIAERGKDNPFTIVIRIDDKNECWNDLNGVEVARWIRKALVRETEPEEECTPIFRSGTLGLDTRDSAGKGESL